MHSVEEKKVDLGLFQLTQEYMLHIYMHTLGVKYQENLRNVPGCETKQMRASWGHSGVKSPKQT